MNSHITDIERVLAAFVKLHEHLKLLLVEQSRMHTSLHIQLDRIERLLRQRRGPELEER